jgi:hypothetical protein
LSDGESKWRGIKPLLVFDLSTLFLRRWRRYRKPKEKRMAKVTRIRDPATTRYFQFLWSHAPWSIGLFCESAEGAGGTSVCSLITRDVETAVGGEFLLWNEKGEGGGEEGEEEGEETRGMPQRAL